MDISENIKLYYAPELFTKESKVYHSNVKGIRIELDYEECDEVKMQSSSDIDTDEGVRYQLLVSTVNCVLHPKPSN